MAGVIVPLYPGVFSAIGLMMSDVKHDYIQSRMDAVTSLTAADLESVFARLAAQALADLRADGFAEAQIGIERAVDMRYAGQGYEITVACDAPFDLGRLRAAFDARHQAMFGHSAADEPVEIVSYRVRGIGKVPPVEMPRFKRTGTPLGDARRETRCVRHDGATIDCPVYQREKLDVGAAFAGPAVLDQLDCTTVICPGQVARVDEWKNLIVTEEK